MREFRNSRGRGKERYWIIEREEALLRTSWGNIINNAHSEAGRTQDLIGPKGKPSTKSWCSATENAQFQFDRLIRKKREEGYVEVDEDGLPLEEMPSAIIWGQPLPKNLAFSKPKNSMEEEVTRDLSQKGLLIFTRKINGMTVIMKKDESGIELYSRRMDVITGKFPAQMEVLQKLPIPDRTIALFESFVGKGNSQQDFHRMQSIMLAHDDVAAQWQEDNEFAQFYLYRTPFVDGQPVEHALINHLWIDAMVSAWQEMFEKYLTEAQRPYFHCLETYEGPVEEAISRMKANHYEGWVVYRTDKLIGPHSFSFHGKPGRPSCCFKLKDDQEDDFIAHWGPDGEFGRHCKAGCMYDNLKQYQQARNSKTCPKCGKRTVGDGTWGTGKHMGAVGTMSLYQLDNRGIPVYICEVGTGLTDEEKLKYANPVEYPLVVRVKYGSRLYMSQGDKTNALQHPRVDEIRTDKHPDECIHKELRGFDEESI